MAFLGPEKDRLAIRELVDSYGDAVCRGDRDAWGANWAEDAVWTLNLPGLERVEGREAIVSLWSRAMGDYEYVLMTSTPGAIEIEGDVATGRFYTSEITRTTAGENQRIAGRYEDKYARKGGRWYFTERQYKMLFLEVIGENKAP